jgi:hypothetical protein
MAEPVDGLSILQDRRAQAARRGAPPPSHPRPVSVPADVQQPHEPVTPENGDVDVLQPAQVVQAEAREPSQSRSQPRKGSGAASKRSIGRDSARTKPEAPPAASGLRPAQFYVDDACNQFLRAARADAQLRELDVSGSAVVRLALRMLMEQFSPQEVNDRLAEPVAERGGSGRKRH